MAYSVQTVAAAIITIADNAASEQNISATDSDGMAKIMVEAEEMVAKELIRNGVSMQEALQIAENAALTPGRESAESKALAQDAFRNRHASVPTGNNDNNGNAISGAEANSESSHAVEDNNNFSNHQQAEGQEQEHRSFAPAHNVKHQVQNRLAHVARPVQEELMGYEVTMKKVHEIFRSIDENDNIFDFEIPFVNWNGRREGIPQIDPAYMFEPEALHTVLYAISQKASLNIVGPHGCGKTQIVAQVAARLNFPLTILPMDGQLSRREMIGQEKLFAGPNGTESYFSAGLLPKAMVEPGFILFDELDRGVSDLQYACHSVYLQEGLTILEDSGRFIPCHEHNRIFGTSNTKGRGSVDGMYQPPEEMSEATRDRWSVWLEMNYNEAETDEQIIKNKVDGISDIFANSIAEIAKEIRSAYNQGRLAQTCSMRQQLEVARLACFMSKNETDEDRKVKTLRYAIEKVIGGRASEEDKGVLEVFMQTKIPQAFVGKGLFDL
jgi:cobaltochelatase CobS